MATMSIFSMTLTAIIMMIGGSFIYNAFTRTNSKIYLYFSLSFFGYGIMHFLLAVGAYFSGTNPEIAGLMYPLSHVLLFLSIAFFLRVPLKLVMPKAENVIFYFALAFALIGSFLLFTEIPLPEATPKGLTAWNIPEQTAAMVGTFTTVMLLFAITLFLLGVKRTKDVVYKKRAVILTIGVFIFLIAGPAHNFATSFGAKLFADTLTPIGALIMLYGIYYPHLNAKKSNSAK